MVDINFIVGYRFGFGNFFGCRNDFVFGNWNQFVFVNHFVR